MLRKLTRPRSAAALAATGAVALGLMVASASSASAVVVSRDFPLLSAGTRDFGTNVIGGVPQTGGTLRWDLIAGTMFPRLTGNLYLANGVCGRINVVYHDAAAVTLGQLSTPGQCSPGAGVTGFPVALVNFGSPQVDHVHINLQRPVAGGGWVTVATVIESP